jgi:hypothetical protein
MLSLIYTFSKSIKGIDVTHKEICDAKDITKIEQVVLKLEQLSKGSQLQQLDELGIRTNPKKWIVSLMGGYPYDKNIQEEEYLLIDFTEAMKTRMREESKYAIGLLMPGKLILCHSIYGEETITPDWKTIPRMLDIDNILRYVCIYLNEEIHTIRYWEKEATSSFIEWLGLPKKTAFLFGGKYRIHCEIEGLVAELQLNEEEMARWIKNNNELKKGMIKLSQPIHLLNIDEIRVGRKRYEKTMDFIQDYEAEAYGIHHYQKEYDKILKDVRPLFMKYYDEKTGVVRKEQDEEVVDVVKDTPNFDILFVCDNIEFRASYITDIARRFINGEVLRIFHAGVKFNTPPFILDNIEIYNEVKTNSLIKMLEDYFNKTKLQDRHLITILKYIALQILLKTNEDSPLAHFFGPLSSIVIDDDTVLQGKFTKLEDNILEYKSQNFLAGNDKEIIKKICDELIKKLETNPCKVFFIGVEDNGEIHPLPASRLKSDRIENLRARIQKQLAMPDIYTLPIIQEDVGILIIVAFNKLGGVLN